MTLQPCIQKIYLDLPKPSIEIRPVMRIVSYVLWAGEISDLSLVQLLPEIMKNGYKVTAVLNGNTVIGVESGDTTKCCYGVAVDIGTTTIVGTLIDLCTGDEIGIYSTLNPQKMYGDDVISV